MRVSLRHFNSIKVRLELVIDENGERALYNFNSIKVRLEPTGAVPVYNLLPFQFHKGAIRTRVKSC